MARRSQLPYLSFHQNFDDTNIVFINDDFNTNNKRIRVVRKQTIEDEEELSDYVKSRLYLARQLALLKFEKAHI